PLPGPSPPIDRSRFQRLSPPRPSRRAVPSDFTRLLWSNACDRSDHGDDRKRRKPCQSHGRLTKASGRDGLGLLRSWPWRRRVAEETKRAVRTYAELKLPAAGNHDTVARRQVDGGRRSIRWPAPQSPATLQHVPDLFDGAVRDGA